MKIQNVKRISSCQKKKKKAGKETDDYNKLTYFHILDKVIIQYL